MYDHRIILLHLHLTEFSLHIVGLFLKEKLASSFPASGVSTYCCGTHFELLFLAVPYHKEKLLSVHWNHQYKSILTYITAANSCLELFFSVVPEVAFFLRPSPPSNIVNCVPRRLDRSLPQKDSPPRDRSVGSAEIK